MIRWYGRKDLGTGILHNRTDGGDGTAGYKQTESHKEKIRKANVGKTLTEKTKEKISQTLTGKKHTSEQKKAKSARQKGKPKSPAWIAKMIGRKNPKISIALAGVPKPKITCPHCGITGGIGSIKRWHFDNCRNKQ